MKKESLSFSHQDYEIIDREVLYQGVFRLARYTIKNRLFAGGWSEVFKREIFERYNAAAVLPYDPYLNRVILIEQFRPGSIADPQSPWLIEIPAGVLGRNEVPEEVAVREAMEEAGCSIQALHPIIEYFVSPGGTNEYISIYCGKVDSRGVEGIHGLKYEQEDIRVLNLSLEEALAKLYTGQVKTSHTLIALLWLQIHSLQMQEQWR